MEQMQRQLAACRERIAELDKHNSEQDKMQQRLKGQLWQIQEDILQEMLLLHKMTAALEQTLEFYEEGENRAIAILEEERFWFLEEELQVNKFQWLAETGMRFESQ